MSDMLNCIGPEDIAVSQNNCLPVCALQVQKWLANGDNAELHPVAYSSTRSSAHAFKLPVIKHDFYKFSKSILSVLFWK